MLSDFQRLSGVSERDGDFVGRLGTLVVLMSLIDNTGFGEGSISRTDLGEGQCFLKGCFYILRALLLVISVL